MVESYGFLPIVTVTPVYGIASAETIIGIDRPPLTQVTSAGTKTLLLSQLT